MYLKWYRGQDRQEFNDAEFSFLDGVTDPLICVWFPGHFQWQFSFLIEREEQWEMFRMCMNEKKDEMDKERKRPPPLQSEHLCHCYACCQVTTFFTAHHRKSGGHASRQEQRISYFMDILRVCLCRECGCMVSASLF